jgi:hypothetical protein
VTSPPKKQRQKKSFRPYDFLKGKTGTGTKFRKGGEIRASPRFALIPITSGIYDGLQQMVARSQDARPQSQEVYSSGAAVTI